ncbi:hypothetical protein AB0L75_19425 [Streptomyces sp. NPDC052101]|uniref:hypothetical protein n=1 Tax=Streptomyces sp. NPDC052101 TaxID=3155763 RepID=UPI00342C2D79
MTAGWGSRTVRAAVFAAVCVVLAALGHVLMSGGDVPAWALAAGLAATGGVGWCLTGRERGPLLIVPLVVATQAALHSAFSFAQSASGTAPPMVSGHMGMAMDMGSMSMGSMGSTGSMHMGHMGHMGHASMSSLPHMGHSLGGDAMSFGMTAAHLLAALLTGLWLAYGEQAAFRILRAVAGWLAAPLRLVLALPVADERPDQRLRRPRSDRAPSLDLLIHTITSRGPPEGTAVA